MTADNAPSPYVASALSESVPAFQAFDGNTTSSGWYGNVGGVTWLQIDLGSAQSVGSYAISYGISGYANASAPNSWTMQGSADGSTWVTVDTQTGQVFTNPQTLTYTVAAPVSYRYWRLNITANNGDATYTGLGELLLYAVVIGTTPQTITFPAISGPALAATASSGLTVSYAVTSGPATVSGSTLSITGAGTIVVQATQPGNGTYAAAAPVSQSLAVLDIVPHTFTTDTSDPPWVISASTELGGYQGWEAFNAAGSNSWAGTNSGVDWLQVDTGAGNAYVLFAYALTVGNGGAGSCPKSWTFEGSNDGATWVTLDSQPGPWSNAGPNPGGKAWGNGMPLTPFPIASPGIGYRYFRLNVTANNGSADTEVDRIYLYGIGYVAPTPTPNTQRGNIAFDQIKGTDRTGNGDQLLTYSTAPAHSNSTGAAGQIAFDGSGNWYWCFAANLWARIGPGGFSASW